MALILFSRPSFAQEDVPYKVLSGHDKTVFSVAFSPDGRYLASGSWDKTIKLWEIPSGNLLKTMEGHKDDVFSVAFSPDGRYLASGSWDESIKLWEIPSGQLVKTFKGHGSYVYDVAFSPDGRYLASGSEDRTVKLREIPSGNLLETLPGYEYDYGDMALNPNGEYVAASFGSAIKLWDLSSLGLGGAIVSKPSPPPPEHVVNVDTDIPRGKVSNPDAIAVIIGNGKYEHPDVPSVSYAINDASVFREYLEKLVGVKPGMVIFETNANLSTFNTIFGTKDNPKGKLNRFVKPDKSDVYIYYSGHGAPDPDSKLGYFVPVDCDPSAVALSGYSLQTFYDNLAKLSARSVTVVIDACFSGQSDAGLLLQEMSPVFIEANQGAALANGVIYTSAKRDQVSTWYDEMKHSLFTYFFLKGLRGDADLNKNRSITVGEMADYLQDRSEGVPYWAGRLKGREQMPTVFGDREKVLVKY